MYMLHVCNYFNNNGVKCYLQEMIYSQEGGELQSPIEGLGNSRVNRYTYK